LFFKTIGHLKCFNILFITNIHIFNFRIHHMHCYNPSLGLATKARGYKVVGQERKPGSERKCEGMNLHIPKGAPILGVGVLVDS
jgi:hypothetical protein